MPESNQSDKRLIVSRIVSFGQAPSQLDDAYRRRLSVYYGTAETDMQATSGRPLTLGGSSAEPCAEDVRIAYARHGGVDPAVHLQSGRFVTR
jgi:hypothetical protein